MTACMSMCILNEYVVSLDDPAEARDAESNTGTRADANVDVITDAADAIVVDCAPAMEIAADFKEANDSMFETEMVAYLVDLDVRTGYIAPEAEGEEVQPTLDGSSEERSALRAKFVAYQAQVGSLGKSLGQLAVESTTSKRRACRW